MSLLTLSFSAFATVFLLVFQQQNVIHRKYLWAAVTSVGITLSQVMVIKGVANSGSAAEIVALAIGGVSGVLSSMFIHGRLVAWYGRTDEQKHGEDPAMASAENTQRLHK